MNPDKRALKILFDTYWGPRGWKGAGDLSWTPTTPPDDYAYAKRLGVMFLPTTEPHDATMQRIGELRNRTSSRDVALAFVHSITSGTHGIRSALGSYAVSLNMPLHRFHSAPDDTAGPCYRRGCRTAARRSGLTWPHIACKWRMRQRRTSELAFYLLQSSHSQAALS